MTRPMQGWALTFAGGLIVGAVVGWVAREYRCDCEPANA